jgi:toxin ParE1/3/4
MKIRWLKKALRNLEQVHAFISQDNPETAAQIILKIQSSVEHLVAFPFMGRTGRVEGTRELMIASTPYLVIYRVKGNTVEILRVLHSARKYPDG